jgi:hypothetical protein
MRKLKPREPMLNCASYFAIGLMAGALITLLLGNLNVAVWWATASFILFIATTRTGRRRMRRMVVQDHERSSGRGLHGPHLARICPACRIEAEERA